MYTIEVPIYYSKHIEDDFYTDELLEVDFHVKLDGEWEILSYWLDGKRIEIEELKEGNNFKSLIRNIEEKIEDYLYELDQDYPEYEKDDID